MCFIMSYKIHMYKNTIHIIKGLEGKDKSFRNFVCFWNHFSKKHTVYEAFFLE